MQDVAMVWTLALAEQDIDMVGGCLEETVRMSKSWVAREWICCWTELALVCYNFLFLSYSSTMGWPIRLSYLPILSYLEGLILPLDDLISVWPCGHYYKVQGLTHVVHMFYTE